jgi:DNA-binding MarR family transcriptional regulator
MNQWLTSFEFSLPLLAKIFSFPLKSSPLLFVYVLSKILVLIHCKGQLLRMSSIKGSEDIARSHELLIGIMMQAKHRLMTLAGELNIPGMQAMMVFQLNTPRPMNSFTKLFNCDASNITGLVDGLEQRGLATRFPAEKDRRIKMVKLTASGEKLRNQFIKLLIEDKESSFFNLSPSDLKTFNRLLEKIATYNI